MVSRGFRQIDGQHYDGSNIHVPVTNPGTIRIILILVLVIVTTGEIVDTKEVLLKGGVEKGKEIHMCVLIWRMERTI